VTVTLTWHEVAFAAQVGMRRHIEAIRMGKPDAFGRGSDDGWTPHIEGACGELAVAKSLGVYWAPTVNTFREGGDVGALQVRTRRGNQYELIVRPHDADDDRFVLARGLCPTYDVVGWILGKEAKRAEWLQEHGGHGHDSDGRGVVRIIYKYPLEMTGYLQVIDMPRGAVIRHCDVQNGQICLWAEVDMTASDSKGRSFGIVGTGLLISDAARDYVGTVQIPPYVWHVYECVNGTQEG
jgi:hypothetical protein